MRRRWRAGRSLTDMHGRTLTASAGEHCDDVCQWTAVLIHLRTLKRARRRCRYDALRI